MILIIASFLAVGVSICAVILSDKRTKESNDLLRKDLSIKLRPWIKIEQIKPEFVKRYTGDLIPWNMYVQKYMGKNDMNYKDMMNFHIPYTNFGVLPALKVNAWFRMSPEKITKKHLLQEKSNTTLINIMPNETKRFIQEIPFQDYDNWSKETSSFRFAGIVIEYDIDEKNSLSIRKIWRVRRDGTDVIEEWYEQIKN